MLCTKYITKHDPVLNQFTVIGFIIQITKPAAIELMLYKVANTGTKFVKGRTRD